MNPTTTALILIGFQNDYYAPNGVLHDFLENSDYVRNSLATTVALVKRLAPTKVTMIETSILFSCDYAELREATGILAAIRDARAFQEGTPGSDIVEELQPWCHRVLSVPGKCGFDAFVNTGLEDELRRHRIQDVVLLGSIASICIDATGRSAAERGFTVHFIEDCITGRTQDERDVFCKDVFPHYGQVTTAQSLGDRLCL
ncbi:MAG: cysteine hydrolase family protein [Rhodocyclaceae bacterium]|nr:cysteine hydrolase family protein [Rhodocyclaceae bacterium]